MKKFKIFTSLFLLCMTALVMGFNVPVMQNPVEKYSIEELFIPSGFIGCNNQITIEDAYQKEFHSAPFGNRITFIDNCDAGWAGIYWQLPTSNFGDKPGINLSGLGYSKVTFWAKGETGGEVIEFGSGCIDDPKAKFKDSYCAKIANRRVVLENEWVQYSIEFDEGTDLNSVVGAFYWSSPWRANSNGLVFYLDDMQFE